MSALVNLMQFVVIALLLVCVAARRAVMQLAKARPLRRRSAAERGRRRSFCCARNGPPLFFGGSGEKDRRQPLWTGRQLRPACHATQTEGEVRWPRRKLGEQPTKKRRGPVSSLSSCPDPNPDEAELFLTLPHVSRRLVSVATRCVLSGRAAGRPSKHRQPVRITGISKRASTADR